MYHIKGNRFINVIFSYISCYRYNNFIKQLYLGHIFILKRMILKMEIENLLRITTSWELEDWL